MDYFYERNIVEIKNEYTTFLINIITPFIYEGIKSVYSFAINTNDEFIERGKHDPDIKSPGVLKLFQISLKEIPTLNNHSIEVEVNRIKSGCKCADWFDDLVRAVIKCNIVLLTFNNPKKKPELLKEKYHEKIEIKDFIHKCYIETARAIYNNPELYWHEFPPLEIKRNQREACELIKQAINEAIRKMLPIKLILNEYLSNNYEDSPEISDAKYLDIHSMVQRDLHGVPGREPVPAKSVLLSDDDVEALNEFQAVQDGGGNNKNEDYYENLSSGSSNSSSNSSSDSSSEGSYSSSGSSESSSEKYNNPEKNQEEPEYQEEDDDDAANVLLSVKQSLQELEEQATQLKNNNQTQQEEPLQSKIQEQPKIQIAGTVPRAEHDDEIKELLKKPNVVNTIDKKKKLSKKDKNMINELQNKLTGKDEDKNKQAFFEQYMQQ